MSATVSSDTVQARCAFVLPKKKRSCRMLVRSGETYCGEHAVFKEDNEFRIPCPNDPKHTVDRRSLQQHLLRCNSRVVEEQWISKDINAFLGETKFTDKIDRRANEEEIANIIEKLQSCYSSIQHEVSAKQTHSAEIEDYLEQNCNISEGKRKHLLQQGSIIGHLQLAGLLRNDPSACVFELGAGKAQLVYWMTKRAPLSRFLLIDRSGARNKYDRKALQENPLVIIKRLRCSIEHLNLLEVEMLKDVSSLCAVCKHFCGSATDAGIRCLSNGMRGGLTLDGFVLVPCCHHKSRYSEYSGRVFLAEWNMDSEGDFAALRHIATWAVCGFAKVQLSKDPEKNELLSEQSTNTPEATSRDGGMGNAQNRKDAKRASRENERNETELIPWSPLWKEEMGRRAKVVLEIGRARHLASLGFSTKVLEYVPTSVSPENLLILGVKHKLVDMDNSRYK